MIQDRISRIDSVIAPVVDTERIDSMQMAIDDISNDTPVGKTLIAINSIGKVKLSSIDIIKDARNHYDKLSNSDKERVFNISTLSRAESKLKKLKKLEKQREEARKQKEEARKQKEREQREKIEKEEAYRNEIVYLTATGRCYHIGGCRMLHTTDYPISRADAEARGYSPCGICNAAHNYY